MGNNKGSQNLVVMTNKDVHFITLSDVSILAEKIAHEENIHRLIDVKSGQEVYIQISNISTVIVEEARNA